MVSPIDYGGLDCELVGNQNQKRQKGQPAMRGTSVEAAGLPGTMPTALLNSCVLVSVEESRWK